MKNRLLKIFAAVCVLGIFAACADEFLDIPAQGALDQGLLQNQEGVEASLISAYSMLDGWANQWGQGAPWPTAGSNWIWGSVASDDAYKGSEPGDQGETSQIELFQWTPGNPYFQAKFVALYEGIARANATKKLLLLAADDIGADDQARIDGEIRFLRAHFHFDGVKLWGNIPYYDETDEDFRKPNDASIIPQITADLEAAAGLLPATTSDKGRATKGAAQAYLGKVHLYQQNWAEAKSLFDQVVNSGNYELNPCFKDMFTTANENANEMIFSIQATVNDGTGGGDNGNFADRLNFPHGGSPFGCCGFHQPSQNLVNAHKVDANGLPLFDTFNDSDVDLATPVDPRLDWTIGRDDVPFLGWGIHEPTWIRSRAWAGPYSAKKFIYNPGEESSVGWSNLQLNPVNMPIIRYADVLLMLAEAEVELGNLERARELVNLIRARAANCAQGPDGGSTNIDDAGITWATYAVGTYDDAWTDQAAARTAVRMERRIELALEGHRFFDLRRWGIAQQVMNAYMDVEQTKRTYITAATRYEDRHNLFPLPSVQIELSKVDGTAQLIQNSGW